jgi:hypothetical protein
MLNDQDGRAKHQKMKIIMWSRINQKYKKFGFRIADMNFSYAPA